MGSHENHIFFGEIGIVFSEIGIVFISRGVSLFWVVFYCFLEDYVSFAISPVPGRFLEG